ncbi:MAG: leucine-rich repeat domain-containing protein [Bacteroidaceae bacterium]|nr:leucine-rich repeat domain-containing protein [Bacteroidaceae bacterium]
MIHTLIIKHYTMKQNYALKQILSAVILLVVSMASWAQKFEVDGIRYNINGDKESVSVTQKSSGRYRGDIVIPSLVVYESKRYSVTGIEYGAFYRCSSLTSIDIPSSVTSIGSSTFYDCSSLTSIKIPSSVTSIGKEAFYRCSSLTSIDIPSSVTSIGSSAFYDCSSLTSIKVSEDNTEYDSREGCNAIIHTSTNSLVELKF